MTSNVTAYVGQMVSDAVSQLNAVDSVVGSNGWVPTFSENYNYTSSVAGSIGSFLDNVELSHTCDPQIAYIDYSNNVSYGGVGNFGGGGGALVLGFADPSGLIEKLGETATPSAPVPIRTDIQLPQLSQIPIPGLVTLPAPPDIATLKMLSPTYQDSYLTAIMTYVQGIVSGNLPADIYEVLNTEVERLEYNLSYALQGALADTAARGFRLPNSRTLYSQRAAYEAYFKAIERNCGEFTDAVQALFLDAHKLGISTEQLEMDFTRHINSLSIALAENEISAYEQKIAVSVDAYNASIAKANASLAAPLAQVQDSLLQVKALIVELSAEATNATLDADYSKRLEKFANVYSRNNSDAVKERVQKIQSEQFERDSEVYKTLHDLAVDTQEFKLKAEVVRGNQQVLANKLEILQNDLEAYSSLARIAASDVDQAKAEWDKAKKAMALKLHGLEGLPKVLDASSHIVSAMLASDITLQKKTGSA